MGIRELVTKTLSSIRSPRVDDGPSLDLLLERRAQAAFHEVKPPLALLNACADRLRRFAERGAGKEELRRLHHELSDNLRSLHHGLEVLRSATTDVQEVECRLFEDIVEPTIELTQGSNLVVRLNSSVRDQPVIKASPARLRAALSLLLREASRHAPKKVRWRCESELAEDGVRLVLQSDQPLETSPELRAMLAEASLRLLDSQEGTLASVLLPLATR